MENIRLIPIADTRMKSAYKMKTHRIHLRNLIESEPPNNLLPKCLSDVNQYVFMLTTARAIIDKKRSIAPEYPQ